MTPLQKLKSQLPLTLMGKISKEVQVFEGKHEEVMSKVKLITEDSEAAEGKETKRVKKIEFLLNPKSGSETNGTVFL